MKPEESLLSAKIIQSDNLLEKLKILNYEKILHEFKMKPLSRFYFVKSRNPGEQFFMFTLIGWWLCKTLGKQMDRPQEYDDPNAVIAKFMQILEETGVPIDFQPNKLIRGAGPICLLVLNTLATQAVKVAKVNYQRPHVNEENENPADYLEDNAEIILEKLEDDQNPAYSDDSDIEVNDFKKLNWLMRTNINSIEGRTDVDVLIYTHIVDKMTSKKTWRLEFERVLPQLKVCIKADARDWHSHITQIEAIRCDIKEIYQETLLKLKKLHSKITFSVEKIDSREKHLNNDLKSLVKEFKDVSIELSNTQYAHAQVQSDTEVLLVNLTDVISENDIKKAEMEQRSQCMSDGSNVVNIKKSIRRLRDDLCHLNLEVSLVIHRIDQDLASQMGSTFLESIVFGSMAYMPASATKVQQVQDFC